MNRLPFLDGLRGVLALLVVMHHFMQWQGHMILHPAAQGAVLCFFAMSGYVLARAYDGRPLAFIAKRLVRLWPLYASCLVVGFAIIRMWPTAGSLLAWPPQPWAPRVDPDPPDWSLHVEIWMTPVLLGMFLAARAGRPVALAVLLAASVPPLLNDNLYWTNSFAAGVAATKFDLALPETVPPWMLWLGKVSYSLYLSHWVVITACVLAFGQLGLTVAMALVLPVAWLLWWAIERPCIAWSRRIGAR